MINTYNESELHHTLKVMYQTEYNGKTEVEMDGHIYDILSEDETVIEIQTKNLSKLLPKILDTIEHGHRVVLVHPLVTKKWIKVLDTDNKEISFKKSPKNGSIYDLFDELTGIYPVLTDRNFRLEVLETSIIECRQKTKEPVQTANKKRRFKKDWIKTGKTLKEINGKRIFTSEADFLNLLPDMLPKEFCAKDIYNCLKEDKTLPSSAARKAHLIIWVLSRMNLIVYTETKNRSRYYKINDKFIPPDTYGTFIPVRL